MPAVSEAGEVRGNHVCKEVIQVREVLAKTCPWFGDPEASLAVTCLASAAHGGNRTGRVFTGDESGRFS